MLLSAQGYWNACTVSVYHSNISQKEWSVLSVISSGPSFLSWWTFRIRWDIVMGLSCVGRTFSSISGHIHPPLLMTLKNTSKYWHILHGRQGKEGTMTFYNGTLTEGFVLKERQRSQTSTNLSPTRVQLDLNPSYKAAPWVTHHLLASNLIPWVLLLFCFLFAYLFFMLRIEPRTCMWNQCSTTELHPQSCWALFEGKKNSSFTGCLEWT
jgi:hypothetical protein